jgi:hypothetical protein
MARHTSTSTTSTTSTAGAARPTAGGCHWGLGAGVVCFGRAACGRRLWLLMGPCAAGMARPAASTTSTAGMARPAAGAHWGVGAGVVCFGRAACGRRLWGLMGPCAAGVARPTGATTSTAGMARPTNGCWGTRAGTFMRRRPPLRRFGRPGPVRHLGWRWAVACAGPAQGRWRRRR